MRLRTRYDKSGDKNFSLEVEFSNPSNNIVEHTKVVDYDISNSSSRFQLFSDLELLVNMVHNCDHVDCRTVKRLLAAANESPMEFSRLTISQQNTRLGILLDQVVVGNSLMFDSFKIIQASSTVGDNIVSIQLDDLVDYKTVYVFRREYIPYGIV